MFEGIYAALLTPFDEAGSLCEGRLVSQHDMRENRQWED